MLSQRQNINNHTALMVFSLSPGKETERKPLFGPFNKRVSNHFFKLLIDHTAKIASESGVDIVWVDENHQRGNNFAERFTNAFKDVFALGYEHVISIGNDCPELTKEILQHGIGRLKYQDLVLGPSRDGGVYLIGFNKNVFDEKRFFDLPWMQDNLFQTIVDLAEHENIDFHCFRTLADLDKKSTVFEYAKRKKGTLISRFIFSNIFCNNSIRCIAGPSTIQLFSGHIFSLRAPPIRF